MSVAKSSFLFAGGTLVSRLSGLIRDQIILGVFGASVFLDAFYVAYRIPNLFREMLAEGALGSAFTKVYSSINEENPAEAKKLLRHSLYLAVLSALVISAIGIIASPLLVKVMTLAKPESETKTILVTNAIHMTRILFPYLGIMIVSSITMGVLHQKNRFFYSAISPTLLNLGYIIGALIISNILDKYSPDWFLNFIAEPRITGLALGALLGALMLLLFQIWGIWKPALKGIGFRLKEKIVSPNVKKVLKLMLPASIAASTGPINLMINTNFATSLESGAVTWLNSAFRLLQLPIGIFGVAVSSVILPKLAQEIVKAGKTIDKKVSSVFQNSIELVIWLMSPCMVFLLCNYNYIVQLLYQHGNFRSFDAKATGMALYAYSFSVISYGLIKVLTSFYFSVERTSYAMKASIGCIIVNLVGNLIFVDIYGHTGLAITTSCTLTINALILIIGLKKHKLEIDTKNLCINLLSIGAIISVSYILQNMLTASIMSIPDISTLHIKISSAIVLAVNGLSTVALFIFPGYFLLKKKLG